MIAAAGWSELTGILVVVVGIWFLPSNSESTNWNVSSKGLPPTKRDNLVVSMLVLVFGWGRHSYKGQVRSSTHDWCAMCQILRVSGLRGTQMVDIRQPRGRLDLEVDKQWLRIAKVIHYCQWMREMVLSRPPKGQESQIMTKCELKGHII